MDRLSLKTILIVVGLVLILLNVSGLGYLFSISTGNGNSLDIGVISGLVLIVIGLVMHYRR